MCATKLCEDPEVDLRQIPLVALNVSVRRRLSLYLNPRCTVAADWTTVAESMDFEYLEIKNFETSKNPTLMILEVWEARSTNATVGKLLDILEASERRDIVEELRPLIGWLCVLNAIYDMVHMHITDGELKVFKQRKLCALICMT